MAITSATSRNDYAGNGAVDTYAYTFKVFLESDLLVKVRDADGAETTLTLTTHYTVTGEGNDAGGNVALVNGAFAWLDGDGDLKTGYDISILRRRPLTQTADFKNQGTFYGLSHENTFDHLVMIDQQQQDQIDRAFKLPDTIDPDDFDTALPGDIADSPGYVVAINDDGDGFTLIQVPDLDAIIDLDLGSSGNPGSLDIFPATAARGRLRFTATNNAGDTVTSITNAAQAAARTYTIPDAGADASFVMTAGAQTIAGVKTFSSELIGPAGSVNAPSFTVGTAGVGMYRSATNTIGFATNSTLRVTIDANGDMNQVSGTYRVVGTGTATFPDFARIDDTNTGMRLLGSDVIALTTGGTDRVTVDASGYVGIGTTSPGSYNSNARQLVIATTSGNVGMAIRSGSNQLCYIAFQDTESTTIPGLMSYENAASAGNEFFAWRVGGTDNVINLTPNSLLLNVGSASNPSMSFIGDPDTGWYRAAANDMAVATGGTFRWRFQSAGNFFPSGGGNFSIGDSGDYVNDISYKTLTDRGCIPWCDDGVEVYDDIDDADLASKLGKPSHDSRKTKRVSDLNALCQIRKHPTNLTVHGLPRLDYNSFPVKAVRWAEETDDKVIERDANGIPWYTCKITGERRRAEDGVEMTMVFGVMIGAFKEVSGRLQSVDDLIGNIDERLQKLETAKGK